MKMTTDQFLSHLGIEGEQEFRCPELFSNKTYKVMGSTLMSKNDGTSIWNVMMYGLGVLIGKEIILPPKYDLTEKDKLLISLIPIKYKWIYRYLDGTICVSSHMHEEEKTTAFSELDAFNDFLKCLGTMSEVNLDELRKLI